MKRLRYVCFSPLLLLFALNYGVAYGKQAALPNQADALVSALYTELVARHPLGIPYGEDMLVLEPYLSSTLLAGFDVNQACIADWFRQNPDPDSKPRGLFEDGVFSGTSERAYPQAFAIEKTEVEKDGSSRVYVKLTWDDESNDPMDWHVAAVVVLENGRPVLKDVFFLNDDDLEIDSRLSEWLVTGCDGPRWVGNGALTSAAN